MANAPKDPASAELEAARKLAATDGNAFHARVAMQFRQWGWDVLISPYYVDNATGQAREIDLLCERLFTFEMDDDDSEYGVYRVQLFVECKYVTAPVVFWFDVQDRERTLHWLNEHTPFTRGRKTSLSKHRYIHVGTQVAKLFRSATNKQDPIYTGLAQSLGALIQRRGLEPMLRSSNDKGEPAKEMTVQYPVIICSDGPPSFYRTEIEGHPSSVLPEDHLFQLEVDYAYMGSKNRIAQEYFLIDIVRFSRLGVFLQLLDVEAEEAARLLSE
jgi:hypothetical protein